MSDAKSTGPTATDPTPRPGAWDRFWFSPADPTLLGALRILAGLVTVYTMVAYTFDLQAMMGENAWYDLETRLRVVHDRPVVALPLAWSETKLLEPEGPEQERYVEDYKRKFGSVPPAPYPADAAQATYLETYRKKYGFDLRAVNNLPPPADEWQRQYLENYTQQWRRPPPPPYPDGPDRDRKAILIDEYITQYGHDPRSLYARGTPVWSLWFDVTDPAAMMAVHLSAVVVCILFTVGFCTRLTSVLTWMTTLWYIHRNPVVLFGVDTMQTIILLYLMIGPSGAALSVDRLISRWWSANKLRVVNRWRGLFGQAPLTEGELLPAEYAPTPQPSVSANVALRLLQIHTCIIYLVAGLAKLQGTAWWTGVAVWGTLANAEFAPMYLEWYNDVLRFLGRNRLVFAAFLWTGGMFTLIFEISYPFLIWRPRCRWWLLGGAIVLHGIIGLFMGLGTFAVMMLVMNMAFLKPSEVHAGLNFLARIVRWGKGRESADSGRPRTAGTG